MVWTIRHVLKKPGGDPLREYVLGNSTSRNMYSDSRIKNISFWRSSDRAIALIFFTWESEAEWRAWKTDHAEELAQTKTSSVNWFENNGIDLIKELPESEDHDWANFKYIVDGYLGYDRVTMEQIITGD